MRRTPVELHHDPLLEPDAVEPDPSPVDLEPVVRPRWRQAAAAAEGEEVDLEVTIDSAVAEVRDAADSTQRGDAPRGG